MLSLLNCFYSMQLQFLLILPMKNRDWIEIKTEKKMVGCSLLTVEYQLL